MSKVAKLTPPSAEMFRTADSFEKKLLTSVEGTDFPVPMTLEILLATEDMHCLKVTRPAGAVDPLHVHDDHSTIACLISGKVILHIGDETFIAEPGDVWCHPQGVPHYTETLEDSVQIEVKAPAVITW